jgi:hypothetical protein
MPSPSLALSCRLRRGKLQVRSWGWLKAAMARMRDGEYTLTLERVHATRSKAQNDYYHAVVVARIAATWERSADETHEILKAKFLPIEKARTGENGRLMNGLVIGGSTTRLNKLEFIEYLEAIVMWAASEPLYLYIPDPDPLWRQHAEAETGTGQPLPARSA